MCNAVPDVAPASQTVNGSSERFYEGVRVDTDDPEKLIPFVDQLLFFLRVQRYRTQPVEIRESQGVVEIIWNRYVPKAFAVRTLLCVAGGERVDGPC